MLPRELVALMHASFHAPPVVADNSTSDSMNTEVYATAEESMTRNEEDSETLSADEARKDACLMYCPKDNFTNILSSG